MSEKLASTIVMQELPTTTSGWMRTVGNRENVVAVDRSSLRCCVFLKLRFTNWSNRIGILLVFLCRLIDQNLKLRFDSNKFYGMVRHHLCACCLFKGFWKLRSTDLGIRLVFLLSLLDLTFRSQNTFLISDATLENWDLWDRCFPSIPYVAHKSHFLTKCGIVEHDLRLMFWWWGAWSSWGLFIHNDSALKTYLSNGFVWGWLGGLTARTLCACG